MYGFLEYISLKNFPRDISRAGIIKHSLPLLRALLECGYYSREGLIWGNTVSNIVFCKLFTTSKNVHISNKHGFGSNLTVNLGPCSIKGFSMSWALAETKLIEERCNNNTLKWQPQTLRASLSIVIANRTIKIPFER